MIFKYRKFVVLFFLYSLSAYSKTVHIAIPPTSHTHQLDIQQGVVAHVHCDSNPRLELKGLDQFINQVDHSIAHHAISINAHQSGHSLHSPTLIQAHIYLNSAITNLHIHQGGFVTLDACAIDPDNLTVNVQRGGHISMSGYTKKLSVDAAQGGFINKDDQHQFSAQTVNLNCSTGCIVHLNQVQRVSGSLMMGGQLYVRPRTDLTNLQQTVGSKIVYH